MTGLTPAELEAAFQLALERKHLLRLPRIPVGTAPGAILYDGANMWVSGNNSKVYKIDAASGEPLGSYSVGAGTSENAGLAYDGTNVWVLNYSGQSVTKVTAATGDVVGTYSLNGPPRAIAYDGSRIWISGPGNGIVRLNPATGAVVDNYSANVATSFYFDGTYMWAATNGQGLTKFVASTGENLGSFPLSTYGKMAFDGTHFWLTSYYSLIEVDPANGMVLRTVPLKGIASAVLFDGTDIWTTGEADSQSGGVSRVRISDGRILSTINDVNSPMALAFDGVHVWATNQADGSVSRL